MYLMHHGVKNQHWGVRRFQNKDGSLTEEGKRHYSTGETEEEKKKDNDKDEKETKDSNTTPVNSKFNAHNFGKFKAKGGVSSTKKSNDTIDEAKTTDMLDKKKETLENKIEKAKDKDDVKEYKSMLAELDSIDASSLSYKHAQEKVKEIMEKLQKKD